MLRLVSAFVFVLSTSAFAQDSSLLDDAIFQMRKYPTKEPIVGLLVLEQNPAYHYGLKPTLVPRDTLHIDFANRREDPSAVWGGSKVDLADVKSRSEIEVFAQRQKFGLVVLSNLDRDAENNVRQFISKNEFSSRPARVAVDQINLLVEIKTDSILGSTLNVAQLTDRPIERIGSHKLVILTRAELAKLLPAPATCPTVLERHDTFCPYDHFHMHP